MVTLERKNKNTGAEIAYQYKIEAGTEVFVHGQLVCLNAPVIITTTDLLKACFYFRERVPRKIYLAPASSLSSSSFQ